MRKQYSRDHPLALQYAVADIAAGADMARVGLAALAALMVTGSATAALASDVQECKNTKIGADRSAVAAACTRLAEKGEGWAQCYLGFLYTAGDGVPQDGKTVQQEYWSSPVWRPELIATYTEKLTAKYVGAMAMSKAHIHDRSRRPPSCAMSTPTLRGSHAPGAAWPISS